MVGEGNEGRVVGGRLVRVLKGVWLVGEGAYRWRTLRSCACFTCRGDRSVLVRVGECVSVSVFEGVIVCVGASVHVCM